MFIVNPLPRIIAVADHPNNPVTSAPWGGVDHRLIFEPDSREFYFVPTCAMSAVEACTVALRLTGWQRVWILVAWVLWSETISSNPSTPLSKWGLVEASDSHSDCERLADRMNAKLGYTSRRDQMGFEYITRYICLPDTVDPRGPKR